jgi:hypothetical protein
VNPLHRLSSPLALLLALTASSAPAHAEEGPGNADAGFSIVSGDRLGGGGFGIIGHLEYLDMFLPTALGGAMGAEILMTLGYEKFAGEDPHGGEFTQGPMNFDVALGFPVKLFTLGSGGPGTTSLVVGLGAGMGMQHAYGYVRSRILTALGDGRFVELMGRWTPAEASNDWTDQTGLSLYEARISVLTAIGDIDMKFFGEWSTGTRTRIGAGDPENPATPPPETTTDFQSIWRLGVGFVF